MYIKTKHVASVLALATTICLCAGCANTTRNASVENLVNNIETLANTRYTGVQEDTEKLLNKTFKEPLASQIREGLSANNNFITVDISEEESNGLLDEHLVKYKDRYGFFIDTLNTEGEDVYIIVGDTLRKYNLSDYGVVESFKGNPNYQVTVRSYNYYDDGTLMVEMEHGFEPSVSLEDWLKDNPDKEEIDYYDEFYNSGDGSDLIQTYKFTVTQDRKISDVSDKSLFIGN